MTPVAWNEITPEQVDVEGTFTVNGQIEGMTEEATATITVSSELETGINLARMEEDVGEQDIYSDTSPLATATFSASGGWSNPGYYPNRMLDGEHNTFWTNSYSISATAVLPSVNNSRPYEFVQVYWPKYVTFDTINLFFRTGNVVSGTPSASLPASLDVQYWNGIEWVSAANQVIEWAEESGQATTITFDNITTTKVRVGMENGTPYSKQEGNMAITEFEVYYNGVVETEKVEAPTASVEPGTYIGEQTIILSTATEDAEIYYTTDGSIPTIESTKYIEPIIISEDTTIKAIAVKEGFQDSDVAEFNYVIISVSTPVIYCDGPDIVSKGQEFVVGLIIDNLDIDNVSEYVYAADITVSYDNDLFEFVAANKVSDKTVLCEIKEENDSIHIVLSNNEALTPNEILANLKFRAKNVDESTSGSIQVEKALLGAAPSGLVIHADGDTLTININKEIRIPGDINGDGVINVGDLAIAAYYYAAEEGDPNWNDAKAADVNNDGVVDLKDLIFIALEILQ